MPTPQIVDVQALLQPHEATICRVVTNAFDRWMANPERAELFRRTRACLIHNYMMNAAPGAFDGERRIHIIPGQETFYFLVEDRLLFRLKRADQRGNSSNVETQASLAYIEPDAPLIELPDVARVDIVYVVNPLQTKIQDVLVVARDGDSQLFSYSILNRVADSAPIVTLPVEPKPPADRDKVVRLPTAAERKRKREDDKEE